MFTNPPPDSRMPGSSKLFLTVTGGLLVLTVVSALAGLQSEARFSATLCSGLIIGLAAACMLFLVVFLAGSAFAESLGPLQEMGERCGKRLRALSKCWHTNRRV